MLLLFADWQKYMFSILCLLSILVVTSSGAVDVLGGYCVGFQCLRQKA